MGRVGAPSPEPPGLQLPVSTSSVASPAPEKTGSAQSPQEACVRSLPAPGPLQNANSPITAGTAQRWQKGSGRRSAREPDRQTPALTHLGQATGRCPPVALRSPGDPGLLASCLPQGSQPNPRTGPSRACFGHRQSRMRGQRSQRSHFSDLVVGVRELCARPSRPNRAQTPSLTEAVGPELTTPKTPGSHLLSSPHLPHPLPSPNPSHLRLCQPLGSYPG